MQKIVPFTKDLIFKTRISEITSISLDNSLKLNNNLVSGEFIINGTYKKMNDSGIEDKFNYNIPVDITIDSKYDTINCNISIDDFTYEIINEDTLKVNISVMLDDLDIKEKEIERVEVEVDDIDLVEDEIEEIENENKIDSKCEVMLENELLDSNDKEYSIYRVYTYKDDDTIDSICDKYNVNKELLNDYNDLDNVKIGSKLIIPSVDE